jgi:hypothetical protein
MQGAPSPLSLALELVPDFVTMINNLIHLQDWRRFHIPAPIISPARVAETNPYTFRFGNLFFRLPGSVPSSRSSSCHYSTLHHGP